MWDEAVTRLYMMIYQRRLPVEIRFGAGEARAERMLRHLEIALPYTPEEAERRAGEALRETVRRAQLSVSSRMATVLLALLGLLISGLGLLGPEATMLLAAAIVLSAALLYAYSVYEKRSGGGAYPSYYYRGKLEGWLRDASRIAASRSVEEGVARGRAIIGGLIYDYELRRRRGRVYLSLRPV